jgi:hypothetical protein
MTKMVYAGECLLEDALTMAERGDYGAKNMAMHTMIRRTLGSGGFASLRQKMLSQKLGEQPAYFFTSTLTCSQKTKATVQRGNDTSLNLEHRKKLSELPKSNLNIECLQSSVLDANAEKNSSVPLKGYVEYALGHMTLHLNERKTDV